MRDENISFLIKDACSGSDWAQGRLRRYIRAAARTHAAAFATDAPLVAALTEVATQDAMVHLSDFDVVKGNFVVWIRSLVDAMAWRLVLSELPLAPVRKETAATLPFSITLFSAVSALDESERRLIRASVFGAAPLPPDDGARKVSQIMNKIREHGAMQRFLTKLP